MNQEMKERTKASYFAMIERDPRNDAYRIEFAKWCEANGERDLAEDLRGGSEKWLREFFRGWNPYLFEDEAAYEQPLEGIQDLISEAKDEPKKVKKFHPKAESAFKEMLKEVKSPDGWFTARGMDIHSRSELEPGEEELFWHHVHVMTGVDYDESHRGSFGWSCSC